MSRWFFSTQSIIAQIWVDANTGIQLPSSVSIGPGLYIPHSGYIVVNSSASIGSHCTIAQGVTIGHAGGGRDKSMKAPTVGDRVYIGPGACLIGDISIGDDALIGPGAIVTKDVPPRSVVVGNPARVISTRGSFDLIDYPGMEDDVMRQCSLGMRDAHGLEDDDMRLQDLTLAGHR